MRSILANALPALMASMLFSGYACTSDRGITVSGSGGHSQIASGGSGGSGGTAASGGVEAAGGASATGGTTASTNVPVGTGGIVLDSCSAGYPGNPFCGGTTGSAGATSSAGTTGSAGVTGSGGSTVTCGLSNRCDAAPVATGGTIASGGSAATSSGGAGGAGATSAPGDAAPDTTGCSCTGETTTWDCYCQAFDCSKTIAAYTADGGTTNVDVIMEYANCNVVEYWSLFPSELVDAFDLSTGQLVGQLRYPLKDDICPFGGSDAPVYSLSAGRVTDKTCVRSKCVKINSISDMCTPVGDAGPPKGN